MLLFLLLLKAACFVNPSTSPQGNGGLGEASIEKARMSCRLFHLSALPFFGQLCCVPDTCVNVQERDGEEENTGRTDERKKYDPTIHIEENNRMGKTRDLFKKIRDTKGTFHAKMGTIKNRNSMDLTEAEDIKKGWQEYTEELYKKDLPDPDNHHGVITHLEPDILE